MEQDTIFGNFLPGVRTSVGKAYGKIKFLPGFRCAKPDHNYRNSHCL